MHREQPTAHHQNQGVDLLIVEKCIGKDTHPIYISGAEVNSFRFLGISFTHISTLVKKARKLLYFLRKLKKAKSHAKFLLTFTEEQQKTS